MTPKRAVKRVNLSLSPGVVYLVQMLADRDEVPLTQKAKELLEQGLESEEDRLLVELAERRLQEVEDGVVQPLSSEEFWKAVARDQKQG